MPAATNPGDCWFLVGPTAAGKTAVGLELARLLGAEILSLDSMAVYRRMDIGTAKPTAAERAAVPHHLIDLADPAETFSVANYVEAAGTCVKEIADRGREALFVGGTPLYLKALLRGIFRGPPADWPWRKKIQAEAAGHPPEWLHAQLAAVDAASAARLHANDTRRLVRALEVFHQTGQPISTLQKQFDRARPAESCRVFVLDWPRAALYERIEKRVDAMFAAGLVDEVRTLLAASELSHTARQALGYREVIEMLAGAANEAETIELVKTRTRQFAKRQLTWFRSLSECRWIDVADGANPAAIAERIAAEGGKG